MFELKGQIIRQDPMDVMHILDRDLQKNGIVLFEKGFRKSGENIQFCCIHKHAGGKRESRPSCGIRTVTREGRKAGMVHCFACGYTADFPTFVSDCFGHEDFGIFGRRWIREHLLVEDTGERAPLNLKLDRGGAMEQKFIPDSELQKYWKYHNYMFDRGISYEVLDEFDVGYDEEADAITFPVKDEFGRCLFIARRSVKNKFFHYPEDVQKPLYGLPQVYKHKPRELWVTESAFNCLTVWTYGECAVSFFGLGTVYQYEQLKKLGVRKIILGFDGDDAGDRASKRLIDWLKKNAPHIFIERAIIPRGKDINDLSEEQFRALKKEIVL